MTFLKNLFSCYCYNTNESDIKDLQSENKTMNNKMIDNNKQITKNIVDLTHIQKEIIQIQNDMRLLNNINFDTKNNLQRMDDKLNSHFSLLTNKIDNVIMILNTTLTKNK